MLGARTKLLALFEANIGAPFSKEQLAKEAGIFDWARVIRALKREEYDAELLNDGSSVRDYISTTKRRKK